MHGYVLWSELKLMNQPATRFKIVHCCQGSSQGSQPPALAWVKASSVIDCDHLIGQLYPLQSTHTSENGTAKRATKIPIFMTQAYSYQKARLEDFDRPLVSCIKVMVR